MANVISDETMEYVGILAKLELSDAEKEAAKKDMESMLDYIDKLNELDTSNVEPMSHVFPVHNVFREDVVTNGDDRDNLLGRCCGKRRWWRGHTCERTGASRPRICSSKDGRVRRGSYEFIIAHSGRAGKENKSA